MIVKKIHIENFGKLSNIDLQFGQGLNEIFGENGWGKTTLSIFIKAMFYGMPPARENIKMERKKYMPWQGGVFGGYIEYQINDKNYRLTRSFGKTPESDTIEIVCTDTNKLVELPKNEIGEELFGVGKDTFEMTAYFPQLNFKSFSNDQISASVLGLDKFKFDLANVKDAIDKIKKKIAEIKKQKIKTEAFIFIKNKVEELEEEVLILKKKNENLHKKIIQNKEKWNQYSSLLSSSKEQLDFQEQMYKEKQLLNDALQEKTERLNELYSYSEKISNDKKQSKVHVNKKQIFALSVIPVSLIAVIIMYIFNLFALPVFLILMGGIIGLSLILFFALRDREDDEKINLQNENNDEILMLKKEISLLKRNLEIYSPYTNPDSTSYNQVRDELLAISLEGKNLEREKLENENLLEKYLDEFESLTVELEEKKTLNEGLDYNINLLQKTYEYLEQAKENLSERFVAPVNEQMGILCEKINLRGRKFVVDTNFDIIEQTNFGNKDLAYSSEGYKDIMSFCMRVLLIREVYKAERPFIVLDDTFVNLDDENLKKAKDIIKELSREYQVIYICCNSRSSLR